MKKLILTIVLIFLCVFAMALVVPVKNNQATTSLSDSLHCEVHQLVELVESHECMTEDVLHQINSIDLNIRYYIERYHDQTISLLTVIGTIMTLLVSIVAIVIPLLLTKKREDEVDNKLKILGERIDETRKFNSQISDQQSSIDEVRRQLLDLQLKVKEDKEAAETAAIQAKVNALISQSAKETDTRKSIELMTEAIELDPQCAVVYYDRGIYKFNLGDNVGAIKDYDKAIDLNPNYANAYHNRGVVKSALGDYEGAIKDYDKAIDLNPNDAGAYNGKAWSLCSMKDYEAALENADKSLSIETTDAALDTRGVINTNLSRFDEAKKDLDEAIKMNSKNAEYYEHRAALYRKMADVEEDAGKREDLIKLAEADEAKAKELKK